MSRIAAKKIVLIVASVCIFSGHALSFGFTKDTGRVADPEVFQKCWNYAARPDLSTRPTTDATRLYFVDVDTRLEAVDLRTGSKIWSTELGGELVSNLLSIDNALVVVTRPAPQDNGAAKASLRSVSKQTGVTNWSSLITSSDRVWLGAINGIVMAVDGAGSIKAFETSTGSSVWDKHLPLQVTADPHFTAKRVILATSRNEIIEVDPGGQTSVLAKVDHVPTALLPESADRYLIGDERGNLAFTSTGGDTIWRFKHGARISFLLQYDSEFLVASFDNFLYKLSRGGNVEWKARLSGRVGVRPVVSGSTAIVSIIGDETVYFINLSNGKISNRVLTGDDNGASTVTGAGESGVVIGETSGLSLYGRGKCEAQ